MDYDESEMASKKKQQHVEPVGRGGQDVAPSEDYFRELKKTRLHIRLPDVDYQRLVKLAGGEGRLRAYISELINEKWEQRKR